MSASKPEPPVGPAFDPKGLRDGLETAKRLQMAVRVTESPEIAAELLEVGPHWIKPDAPAARWEARWTLWTSTAGHINGEELDTGSSVAAASLSEALEHIACIWCVRIAAGQDADRRMMLAAA